MNITFRRCTSYNNSGNQLDVFPTCLRFRVCGQAERSRAVAPGRRPRHDLRSPRRRAQLAAAGLEAAPGASPRPMSITFADCATTTFSSFGSDAGGDSDGLILSGIYTPGSILVDRLRAVRNGGSGIAVGKAAGVGAASILIRDSVLESNNPDEHEWRGVQESELHLLALPPSFDANVTTFGGVQLQNLSVVLTSHGSQRNKSWLTTVGSGSVAGLSGTVTVRSAIGCPVEPPSLGANATGIELDVSCVPQAADQLGQRVLGANGEV